MKRFLYFAAVACVALVSCTKNEALVTDGSSDQLITFASPVLGVATKATVNTVAYPEDGKFHVMGIIHDNDYSSWDASLEKVYMNTDVKRITATVGTGGTNVTAWFPVDASDNPKEYYWPTLGSGKKLTFHAYSPSSIPEANVSIDGEGVHFSDYTVAPAANVDLLYSARTYNMTSSTDGTGSSSHNFGTTDNYTYTGTHYDGVNILFYHALSSVVFKVKLKEDYTTNNTITLKNITLGNIKNTGTAFNQGISDAGTNHVGPLANTYSSGDWTPGSWTLAATTGTYVPYNSDSGMNVNVFGASDPLDVTDSERLLLPQTLETGAQNVTVHYDLTNTITHITVSCQKTVDLSTLGITEWQKGKRYVYTIIIGLNRIYFAPEVVNWENLEVGNISI